MEGHYGGLIRPVRNKGKRVTNGGNYREDLNNNEKVENKIPCNDYILADENNEEIDINEVNTSVGSEWRSYFDNPECNAVYVVNERLHVAYEILRNLQNYRDVAKARGE